MDDRVRLRLNQMVDQHGPAVLDDVARTSALLDQVCSAQPLECSLLRAALEEGVPAQLRQHPVTSPMAQADVDALVRRLQDRRAISPDAALWAVQSWAQAVRKPPPPGGWSQADAPTALVASPAAPLGAPPLPSGPSGPSWGAPPPLAGPGGAPGGSSWGGGPAWAPPPQPPKKRWLLPALAGLVALGVLGAGVAVLATRDRPERVSLGPRSTTGRSTTTGASTTPTTRASTTTSTTRRATTSTTSAVEASGAELRQFFSNVDFGRCDPPEGDAAQVIVRCANGPFLFNLLKFGTAQDMQDVYDEFALKPGAEEFTWSTNDVEVGDAVAYADADGAHRFWTYRNSLHGVFATHGGGDVDVLRQWHFDYFPGT